MAQFAGNTHWAEPSPLFAHRARPTPLKCKLKCKNEYLVLVLKKETAVQAVVGSIVWMFGRLKKPRGDKRPRLRALWRLLLTFLFFISIIRYGVLLTYVEFRTRCSPRINPVRSIQVAIKIIDKTQLNSSSLQKVGVGFCYFCMSFSRTPQSDLHDSITTISYFHKETRLSHREYSQFRNKRIHIFHLLNRI